jgi:hypothetical protein
MGLLPMIEKGKPVACQTEWPLFYMNDFSRLGVVVSRLAEAVAVLQKCGFVVQADERGALLEIENREQVTDAVHLLATHAIDCEMADLVSCVYQG